RLVDRAGGPIARVDRVKQTRVRRVRAAARVAAVSVAGQESKSPAPARGEHEQKDPATPHREKCTSLPKRRTDRSVARWAVAAMREVLESREPALEVRLDGARRAVAVLAEDDFRDVRVLAVLVVDDVAVDEHDHVGVLLDRAGLAEVGELRP